MLNTLNVPSDADIHEMLLRALFRQCGLGFDGEQQTGDFRRPQCCQDNARDGFQTLRVRFQH